LVALKALCIRGRCAFKAVIADHFTPSTNNLPIDPAVLAFMQDARREGRPIYLATAADKRFANAVAGLAFPFDGVFSTDAETNLKGQKKAELLVATFGLKGFDYIGNDGSDMHIWQVARKALIAGASPGFEAKVKRSIPEAMSVSARVNKVPAAVRSMRPHQWLKNTLVALPVVAGHAFDLLTIAEIALAFVSFCLAASSIYILNDLFDVEHDRAHPEKSKRPFAAGDLSIPHGLTLFITLLLLAIACASFLPSAFLAVITIYIALSLAYSIYLKRKLMVDVIALSLLYGLRVIAGSAATSIVPSDWLLAFCFFLFVSLALMKRSTELFDKERFRTDSLLGRNYRYQDLAILNPLMVGAGFMAVMVLALYINSPEVKLLYTRPYVLWGACVVLTYWLGRAFFLTGRGEMKADPVVFAATDRISLLSILIIGGLLICAI
jgi:4-hydroxybenzoate polyprenyltransferase